MTSAKLQEIQERDKNPSLYWNILVAQQDRRDLLAHIAELESRCKGKMCIDPEATKLHLNSHRPGHLDLFPVQPMPMGALPIYDKEPADSETS